MSGRRRSIGTKELVAVSGFTARQTAVLLVGVLFAGVLAPVGAQAAQVVSAIITDPGGTNQAMVDARGQLHTTSADDPGRVVLQERVFFGIVPGAQTGSALFDVPAGKRLVITHVSGVIILPTGQSLREVSLSAAAGGNATHEFVPAFTATGDSRDHFAFSQGTTIFADGQFSVFVLRNDNTGQGNARVAVSGYLLDCSAAPCNASSP